MRHINATYLFGSNCFEIIIFFFITLHLIRGLAFESRTYKRSKIILKYFYWYFKYNLGYAILSQLRASVADTSRVVHRSCTLIDLSSSLLEQCFSTFVRPRPGKFFFIRRGPGPNKFTRKYLSNSLSSYIKLT